MNETISAFIQIVNGVGFPIAACIGMGCYIVWVKKENQKEHEKSDKFTTDILIPLKTSMDNNTRAIEKLIERIENMYDKKQS